MVHVFVDRETRRPLPDGMPERVRKGLEALMVGSDGHKSNGIGGTDHGGNSAQEQRAKARSKL